MAAPHEYYNVVVPPYSGELLSGQLCSFCDLREDKECWPPTGSDDGIHDSIILCKQRELRQLDS